MPHYALVILWVYIVLLVVGGLIGYLKAKSKVSLIMSSGFAAALALCAGKVLNPGREIATILLVALLVVFALRLAKTKTFMPAGMLLVVTVVTLALINVRL